MQEKRDSAHHRSLRFIFIVSSWKVSCDNQHTFFKHVCTDKRTLSAIRRRTKAFYPSQCTFYIQRDCTLLHFQTAPSGHKRVNFKQSSLFLICIQHSLAHIQTNRLHYIRTSMFFETADQVLPRLFAPFNLEPWISFLKLFDYYEEDKMDHLSHTRSQTQFQLFNSFIPPPNPKRL